MYRYIKSIILLGFLFVSSTASAVDPRLDWKTIESAHFSIHYATGYEQLAQITANAAEQAHTKLQPVMNWQAAEKTHLVVSDESDFANGYATPIHFNRSVLFVAPPNAANGLEDFDTWLETLITHEYTHILHLDKVSGGAASARSFFGRHFLLFPNAYQPGWLIEGLSTYYETDMENGTGRGQSSLFKMMMRSEVDNGVKPVSQVNLPLRSWPLGSTPYLYGVHFYQFIEATYGKQGIEQLIENYSNNVIPFAINTNAKKVFNKDIDELWGQYTSWLENRYQSEMDSHNKAGLVEGKKITQLGYQTGQLEMSVDKGAYFIARGAFEHARLMRHMNNKVEEITDIHDGGAQINVHAEAGVLITQNEYCDEYNINSDIYILKHGEDVAQRITECGRYRSASWSANGKMIIAVKTDKGISQLVLLNTQGEKVKVLWTGKQTDIVAQIKASPQGEKIVAAVFREDAGWNIEEFNLHSLEWAAITEDRYIDMNPSYSDSGKSILFSSERSGRYQIYRYTKNAAALDQLTRVATGAFNPVQFSKESALYYVGYSSNGYDIHRLNNAGALAEAAVKIDYTYTTLIAPEVNTSEEESYSAFSSLSPRWWFPFFSLNADRNEYGITTSGNDALGVHNYRLTAAYDTSNKWLVGNASYAYANRYSFGYQRSTDIIRLKTGEFAIARNLDDFYLSVGLNYPGVESSIRYQLGVITSKETDGVRALGLTGLPETKDNLLGGAMLFNNTHNYIRSISQSDGRNVRLLAETTEVLESRFSGEVYTLDWREFMSLGQQHVLAARFVQGWGTDQPKPFRLGGEENEVALLDLINPLSEPLFNKRKYAMRGYAEGLPQLAGRRMQLASLEWRLPGELIERGFMSPPVGVIQWSASVFAESAAAYRHSSAEKYYSSAGVELQADVNLFYGLTSRMRLGYASGFDSEIGEQRIYFNLGASF